jgi:hypothetical protein
MRKKVEWRELAPWQQWGIVFLTILQLSLLTAALWDIKHRSMAEINGSKAMWIALAFINFIGPLAYFSFGRKEAQET